jgi:hypothetical protein
VFSCTLPSACATQIEIEAPQLEGKKFVACLADTTTSYKRKTAIVDPEGVGAGCTRSSRMSKEPDDNEPETDR